MLLSKCDNRAELISFLKLDYANNLYFFTYMNEIVDPSDANFLIAKHRGEIVLALLLTPIHCCISSANIEYLYAIADQLPLINSLHVVGRKDLIDPLLKIIAGPERNQGRYSFCEFSLTTLPNEPKNNSQKANQLNLDALVHFYDNNDMLPDAQNRLPAVLSWGSVYFRQVDNEIVACALTTTETDDAAMIGAVYTRPQFRSNGYAQDCISSLCRELIANHKKPYLFYQADSVLLVKFYESLGFRLINTWILATKK